MHLPRSAGAYLFHVSAGPWPGSTQPIVVEAAGQQGSYAAIKEFQVRGLGEAAGGKAVTVDRVLRSVNSALVLVLLCK